MVLWTDLVEVIKSNPHRTSSVSELLNNWKSFPIERFPIRSTVIASAEAAPTAPLLPIPIVQKVVGVSAFIDDELPKNEIVLPAAAPAPAPPTPVLALPTAPVLPASPKLPALELTQKRNTAEIKKEQYTKSIDPICIGLEQTDILYAGASQNGKRQAQREEALRIESELNELYKSQGGRNRGWTKVGLEALIKPRCASGGDLYELDRAKVGFVWQLLLSDKPTSAFLDFLCVAKEIRVAVWFEEEKMVIVYPAADKNTPEPSNTIPLYHYTSKGTALRGMRTMQDFLNFCEKMQYSVIPPNSVFHSLSTLTLAELESVGTKLGMSEISGTKSERVAKIASYKLKQRLQSTTH